MIAEPCDREPRGFTPGLFYSTCEKRCPYPGSVQGEIDDAIPDAHFSLLHQSIPSSLPAYLKPVAVRSWREGDNRGMENSLKARP
jgi:hypothetical protein